MSNYSIDLASDGNLFGAKSIGKAILQSTICLNLTRFRMALSVCSGINFSILTKRNKQVFYDVSYVNRKYCLGTTAIFLPKYQRSYKINYSVMGKLEHVTTMAISYLTSCGPPPLKKNRFDFMILNGYLMILNDGICIEKNEKQKNNNFLIFVFEIWSI